MSQKYSIVEYFSEQEKQDCGYCKNLSTSFSHGMWAHTMLVKDYQRIIDRGWRRSGCYCYKPTMDQICCPPYTIKCEALNFVLSRSQRKVLKKVNNFLKNKMKIENLKKSRNTVVSDEKESELNVIPSRLCDKETIESANVCLEVDGNNDSQVEALLQQSEPKLSNKMDNEESVSTIKPVPDKVNQKNYKGQNSGFAKRKIFRRERKRNKMIAQGLTEEEINAAFEDHRKKSDAKSLEQCMDEIYLFKDRLQNKIVRVDSEEFLETLEESAALYKKYQMIIHKDESKECEKKSFINFLVKSPLRASNPEDGPPRGYGSFHDQYWLDGKLIAVGVLDILPACISSVYLFYDPEYSCLSLGTFSSLREVYLTRQLNKAASNIKFYYMGFYIHSCPKMVYKAKMRPSKLLCPETYLWFDVDKCLSKLDKEKYSRLNEDLDAIDRDALINVQKVLVFYKQRAMPYRMYKPRARVNDAEEVKQYASFVGSSCLKTILLYRE